MAGGALSVRWRTLGMNGPATHLLVWRPPAWRWPGFAANRATGYAARDAASGFFRTPMRCHVYKSRTRPDTYVYLAAKDGFDTLPDALRQRLGTLEPALEFDLTPQRRLARSDAATVIAALQTQGFHLQLPPGQAETA